MDGKGDPFVGSRRRTSNRLQLHRSPGVFFRTGVKDTKRTKFTLQELSHFKVRGLNSLLIFKMS